MAKRKSSKSLDAQIAELASIVAEPPACAACGKPMTADATTCPHCGTPVGEAAELHEKAEESLMDLEKHLAETGEEPVAPEGKASEPPAKVGLESAADVVAAVEVSAPDVSSPPATPPALAPTPVVAEIAPEPAPKPAPEPEVETEAEEPEELEGFIEQIEAEVGPGASETTVSVTPRTASTRRAAVRTVHKPASSARSSRWVAPVAGGLVLYVLALFLLALLGRFVVASFMIIGTFLVFAGIRGRPVAPAGSVGSAAKVEDYVCPLCGTEIPTHATRCPTCGAVFEE